MVQPLVLLAALAGLVLAGMAALLDDTGVTGTLGAWLAVAGASATLIGLALLVSVRMGRGLYGLLTVLTILAAGLTSLAGWFLMQNTFAVLMAFVCLGSLLIAVRHFPSRRIYAQ